MVDLHTHSNESDGTYSPEQLVRAALDLGLEALSISDHDTFAGYDRAAPLARDAGLDLICGIELSTRLRERPGTHGITVHLLGYFVDGRPDGSFRSWLGELQASRRDRNVRMAARLRELGIDITLDEVVALGRSQTGRPHFASVLLRKGYVPTIQEAFDEYLGEDGKAYVNRIEPELAEAVWRITLAGGVAAVAHPARLRTGADGSIESLVGKMCDVGLMGIEVYHSDHGPEDELRFLELARRYGLAPTGGSDFHGENKPGVALGTGANGSLMVPRTVLDELRDRAAKRVSENGRPASGETAPTQAARLP